MSTDINTESEIIKGIIKNGVDILENCVVSSDVLEKYIKTLENEFLSYPLPKIELNTDNWFMPNEYKNLDIEAFLVDQCPTENYDRLMIELIEYRNRNLLSLLKQMKYIVDTLRKNNVVWGVGRGSSVASYVLFLLGVHKIDSVKYNLPIEEFFKEIKNG
jgi:DNA polymerase III alpha subunit